MTFSLIYPGGQPVAGLDGRSFLPVLLDRSDHIRDLAYGIHNNILKEPAYPIGDIRGARYKKILNLLPANDYYIKYMLNPDRNDLYWNGWVQLAHTYLSAKMLNNRIEKRPAIEFYDLVNDLYELNNLAGDPL